MTLRTLEIFLAVVDKGSMKAASDSLYISQPSVSGAIADLEKECGTRLFERLGKRLYITPQGMRLSEYARRMLSLNDEIFRQMRDIENTTPLRIGATLTVGACIIGDIIKKACNKNPYVLIQNTCEIEQKLLNNQLDLAIIEGEPVNEDLISEPIISDELVFVCNKSSSLASDDMISFYDLEGLSMIMREKGSGTRQTFENALSQFNINIDIRWECICTDVILNAVKNGFGYTVLSRLQIEKEQEYAYRSFKEFKLLRSFRLVIHKDKFLSPKINEFIDVCRNIAPMLGAHK